MSGFVRRGSGISQYPTAGSDWARDEENSGNYRAREISRGLLFASYFEQGIKLTILDEYEYQYDAAKQPSSNQEITDTSLDAQYTTIERASFTNPSSAESGLEQELSYPQTIMANTTTRRPGTTAEIFDPSEYLPTA